MALSSMTGFARSHGVCGSYAWAWEIKSVNGKGLDLRLRLPSGWDAIEALARARLAEVLTRGSVQANLTVERSGAAPVGRVSAARFKRLSPKIVDLPARNHSPPPFVVVLAPQRGGRGGRPLEEKGKSA